MCVPTTAGLPPPVGCPEHVLTPFEERAEPLVSLSALAGFPQVRISALVPTPVVPLLLLPQP